MMEHDSKRQAREAREKAEKKNTENDYFPDNACWLCHRVTGTGSKIIITSGNGFFPLHMCGDCQRRFTIQWVPV